MWWATQKQAKSNSHTVIVMALTKFTILDAKLPGWAGDGRYARQIQDALNELKDENQA